jgi:hypothetical protein
MSEKKNIDRLFQEKFKDFEAAPPDFVWQNLEGQLLQDKKKRRVVPLWWRMGGIAAALVVGMLFLYPYFTGNTPGSHNGGNGVVLDNKNQPGANGNTTPAGQKGRLVPNPNIKSQGPSGPGGVAATPAKVVGAENETPAGTNLRNTNPKGQQQQSYATNNGATPVNQKGSPAGNKAANRSAQQTGITNAASPQTGIAGNNPNSKTLQQGNPARQKVAVQGQPGLAEGGQGQTGIAGQEGNNSNSLVPQPDIQNPQLPMPGQAIAENKTDSLQQPENELEKLLREQKEQKETLAQNDSPGTNGKWNVKPQLGPLLYSSMTGGSPIDGQFAANSKSYDNQMSYGLGVNYALTDKLSLRSGINTVNLSYATQGIQFYASLNQGTNNVTRASNANIVVQNAPTAPIVPTNSFMNSDALPRETFSGSMVQSTGYIEVPLEMSYALLNRQFGIDVIGGFSTLFLNENSVSVVSDQGLSTNVGSAQNLNNVSFSTNLGIGFKYRFLKQFEANFEPTFKYQVNTYTRESGNFRPYFIGLYTGISFSF